MGTPAKDLGHGFALEPVSDTDLGHGFTSESDDPIVLEDTEFEDGLPESFKFQPSQLIVEDPSITYAPPTLDTFRLGNPASGNPMLALAQAKPTTTSQDAATGWRNPFGLSDEMAYGYTKLGDLASGREAVPRQIGRGMNQPMDSRSEAQIAQDYEREQQKKAQKRSPWAYGGSQAAAETVVTAPLAALKTAATVGGRAIQAMKVGGGLGAASGYGHSEDPTLLGQAEDTALSALAGAVTAPVVGEVTRQAFKIRSPQGVLGAYEKLADQRALRQVKEQGGHRIFESNQTPEDLAPWSVKQFISPEGAEFRQSAMQAEDPKVLMTQSRDLANQVTQISDRLDQITDVEDVASKVPIMKAYMSQEGTEPLIAIESTDKLMDDLSVRVNGLMSGPTQEAIKGTPDMGFLARTQKALERYNLTRERQSPDWHDNSAMIDNAAERFQAADQVKRELQNFVQDIRDRRNSPVIEEVGVMADDLMGHLQNPQVWGDGPASNQSRRNTAWRDYLLTTGTRDASPDRTFLTDAAGIPAADPYKYLRTGRIEGVEKVLQDVGKREPVAGLESTNFGDASVENSLRQWLRKAPELGTQLTEHINPDPAMQALAAEQQGFGRGALDILDTRRLQNMAGRQLAAIEQTPAQSDLLSRAHKYVGTTIGAIGLGGMVANPAAGAGGIGLAGVATAGLEDFAGRSTPKALAGRIRDIAREEAIAASPGGVTSDLLKRFQGGPEPYAKVGDVMGSAGRAAAVTTQSNPWGVDQVSALREWARSNPDTGEGNTRGHDQVNAVRYTLEKNPQVLGPYADRLRNSKDPAKELLKLESDPKWVKDFKPHLRNLVSQ